MGAIVGGIAEAYYGVPSIVSELNKYLPQEMIDIIYKFYAKYINFKNQE